MAPVQDEEQDSGQEQGPTRAHGWGHEKQIEHDLGHGRKHEHDQGHRHQRGHGLGHGHQQRYGHGHEHQRELDYDLEYQGRHGLGHRHQREHGLAHGHKHERGHGHGKHKSKGKHNDGKHNDWRTQHWASSSEDSTTSSAQTQEKTEGPTSLPSLTQPGVAVTFSNFQDSDLIGAVMTNVPPTPTENDDAWIPDIQREPNSLSFNLIPDFPETSPKCPGRLWKPVNGMTPTVEMKELHDFDLSDAFY